MTSADRNNKEMSDSVASEDEMVLEMTFAAHEKDSVQAQSLVKLAAQNLYESLVNDIGALIMNVKEETGTLLSHGMSCSVYVLYTLCHVTYI